MDSSWWSGVRRGEAAAAAAAARVVHAALGAAARQPQHPALVTVPEAWQLAWRGPGAPERYVRALARRAAAAARRLRAADDFPPELDLRDFLSPGRALAAARARAATARGCGVHDLTLAAVWDWDESHAREPTDVLVTGLSLSGAAHRAGLQRAAPRDPPHAPAPRILLSYTQQPQSPAAAASVPLYASGAREAELCRVPAPLAASLPPRLAALHAVALYVDDV